MEEELEQTGGLPDFAEIKESSAAGGGSSWYPFSALGCWCGEQAG